MANGEPTAINHGLYTEDGHGPREGLQSLVLMNPNSPNLENGGSLAPPSSYPMGAREESLQPPTTGFPSQENAANGDNVGNGANGYAASPSNRMANRLLIEENEKQKEESENDDTKEAKVTLNKANDDNMRELEELLTKLNPLAKEFVPPSHSEASSPSSSSSSKLMKPRQNGVQGGKKKNFATRSNRAQREDSVRRTVYVSDIDQQVTEEQLAALFITCGQVVDCRVCGDPNSVLRFAFVEFTDEEGARAALSLSGTVLGYYPVRVLPSKTAIVPVNPTFLPRSEDERELCARTIYCTNIDKKVTQADVKLFFESLCGEVARLRLLGDHQHLTRIAFVEFIMAESAMAALNCSGAILGSLPIRVSPSKTPVRPRSPRSPMMMH